MPEGTLSAWTQNEPGPKCDCGRITRVLVDRDDSAYLICYGHTAKDVAVFPLPETKPPNWPDLSPEGFAFAIETGRAQQGW